MSIVEIILIIVGYCISFLLAIKGYLDKIKATKGKLLQLSLEDDNAKLQILNQVAEFCNEAEKVVGKGNGPLKELFVTCKVDKLATEKGIIITQDEIKSEINKVLTAPQKKV